MAVPPDRLCDIAAVAGDLRPKARLVHGGEVDLDERAGRAGLPVDGELDLGVGVGTDAPGLPVVVPVLPRPLVALPGGEGEPDRRASVHEGDAA
jgi:hypothetical protein